MDKDIQRKLISSELREIEIFSLNSRALILIYKITTAYVYELEKLNIYEPIRMKREKEKRERTIFQKILCRVAETVGGGYLLLGVTFWIHAALLFIQRWVLRIRLKAFRSEDQLARSLF